MVFLYQSKILRTKLLILVNFANFLGERTHCSLRNELDCAVVLLKATYYGAIAILEPTRTDSDGFKLGGLRFPTPTTHGMCQTILVKEGLSHMAPVVSFLLAGSLPAQTTDLYLLDGSSPIPIQYTLRTKRLYCLTVHENSCFCKPRQNV